jgi:hypothetical protein
MRPRVGEQPRSTPAGRATSLASFEEPRELMHSSPRLVGADDLEVLVDEDVVRPVDADVVDLAESSAADSWDGPTTQLLLSAWPRFVAAVDLEGLPVASPPQVMAAMTASAAWSSAASAALILQFEFSETERFVLVQKTSRMFAWADILRQALYETIRSVSYIRESPGHRTPA